MTLVSLSSLVQNFINSVTSYNSTSYSNSTYGSNNQSSYVATLPWTFWDVTQNAPCVDYKIDSYQKDGIEYFTIYVEDTGVDNDYNDLIISGKYFPNFGLLFIDNITSNAADTDVALINGRQVHEGDIINLGSGSLNNSNYTDFSDIPYPNYSTQNYYTWQGTYVPSWLYYSAYARSGLINDTNQTIPDFLPYGGFYDPYVFSKSLAEDERQKDNYSKEFWDSSIFGWQPQKWADDIYNAFSGFADTFFSGNDPISKALNWGTKFAGAVVGDTVGGFFGTTDMLGWAIGTGLANGDLDKRLDWAGSQIIGGIANWITTPIRLGEAALRGDWEKATDPREIGDFVSAFVPVGGKTFWKAASKISDRIVTRNLPKLDTFDYVHNDFKKPELSNMEKPHFPIAKSFQELQDSFKKANNQVITFTPDKIAGDTVGDSRKGALGLEDSGIYVAPKGYGNPYFTRKWNYKSSLSDIINEASKGIDIKWNPIENLKNKISYVKPGRVYETQVKGVVTPPKEVLEKPGFSAVNEWGQKNLVGTGYIRYTKRAMIGQGVVKRQKFYNPETKKWTWESGTKEFEALIDKGYRFVDEGPIGYIEIGGRRIIVNRFSLLDKDGKKVGSGTTTGKISGGKIYNYDEFMRKISKESPKYYYDEYRTINLDDYFRRFSSITYPRYKQDFSINYNSHNNSGGGNNYGPTKDIGKNYNNNANDIGYNNYNKNKIEYGKYTTDYSISYKTSPKTNISYNRHHILTYVKTPDIKPSISSYSPHVSSTINPPTTTPNPPITPTVPPVVPPSPPINPEITTNEGERWKRKKKKKKENDVSKLPIRKKKGSVKINTRDWFIRDLLNPSKDFNPEKLIKGMIDVSKKS